MDRWRGKVAVITGASAGIGLSISEALVRQGMIVVGLARRRDKMENEMKNVTGPGKFHPYACDVSKKNDVAKAFEHIKNTLGTVHVLVNNAGILKMQSIEDTPIEELEDIININLMGTLYCAKEAIKLMKAAGHEAYIININSVAGMKTLDPDLVPGVKMYTNVYSPSKFAMTALSDILTKELRDGKIRVTNLSPGYVKTNIVGDFTSNLADMPILMSKDIADIIVYLIGLPMQVQITQLTVQPLNERF
ncbi:farnesol dehydrogenase [Nasonia vitripennis]|uniref:Uncharacterized protein n=1 Tax=Nasonia vitripennis TaxID=7425 RepID=A0A7M7G7X2_NASVI|nr:farnesol dehydrogenase [Nasonia vitripennis]